MSPSQKAGLRAGLSRTRARLLGRLGALAGRQVDDALLAELEALLLSADLGVATVEALLAQLRHDLRSGAAPRAGEGFAVASLQCRLRDALAAKLRAPPAPLTTTTTPQVVLVLGANGAGKTTTVAKLAARHQQAGRQVLLGAADTFRAAAREQLTAWGERVGCPVITGPEGSDPASVAFDTVQALLAGRADVAIIDTAGRLQTKAPLMEQLAKIARVLARALPGAPHETLLVLDANTGQNMLSQARAFSEAAPITALVLTKLDGSARGGAVIGLADAFGIPVKYLGIGEGPEDLRDFDAHEFAAALFEDAPA